MRALLGLDKDVVDLLVSVRADAGRLVILGAVGVRTVVEGAIAPANGPPAPLVGEVPVEAGEWAVLLALVLQEQWTLIHSKLLQIPVRDSEVNN